MTQITPTAVVGMFQFGYIEGCQYALPAYLERHYAAAAYLPIHDLEPANDNL